MPSVLTPALDDQQATGQDEARAKSRAWEGRNRTYEQSHIKVEGSDTVEQEGHGESFRSRKDNTVGELSDSLEVEERGGSFFSFETHHLIARGTMESISHLIQPIGDPKDRTNLDKGEWEIKSSIDEQNTKEIQQIEKPGTRF